MRANRTLACIAVLLPTVLAVAGCGGTSGIEPRHHEVAFTPEEKQTIDSNTSEVYRIQEGDVLSVAFSYLKELNQDGVLVLSDGSVNLIGVDRIELAGMSIAGADSIITRAYAREYRDPQLSVIVRETTGRQVYVLGEVTSPGLHKLPHGGFDMVGAIAVAGGFTEDAAKGGTVLVRVSETGYSCTEVDLSSLTSVVSSPLATVGLQSYDVVYVPKSRIGNFGYFAENVLAGLVSITRIAADLKYVSDGGLVRF